MKKVWKNFFFLLRRFYTLYEQKFSNMRPFLFITFSQGFWISKNFGHPTLGSGGKKSVKRYLKSEQAHRHTDRQTDTRTHIWTNRLIESIGPEGQFFEKWFFLLFFIFWNVLIFFLEFGIFRRFLCDILDTLNFSADFSSFFGDFFLKIFFYFFYYYGYY